MSELMQSTEMQHEATDAQSVDAAPMSEAEIGAMFDGPEESVTEVPEVVKEETAPEAEQAAPVEPQIQAPSSWPEADKEEFAKLPRAMQEKILTRERERDAYLTKKTQEIAEKSRSVQSLEVLGEALKADPGLRDYLAAYKRQDAPKPPDDPIDRIAWEAEQRALAKVQEQISPVLAQLQAQQRVQETLSAVKADPHHKEVYEEIGKWLHTMPPHFRDEMYQRLDRDTEFFSRTYDHIRAQVLDRAKSVKTPQEPAAPQPVERKTKAPLLETPGGEQPPESRKKRFSELKSRAYDGDTAALGALFDM